MIINMTLLIKTNCAPQLNDEVRFTTDLFEVRHWEQLLNSVKEVRNEGLEGRVKTIVEDLLKKRRKMY